MKPIISTTIMLFTFPFRTKKERSIMVRKVNWVAAILVACLPGRLLWADYGDFKGQVKLKQEVYTLENAPETPKLEDLPLQSSLSQYGITWTFDRPVRVGQFITGDYYVVGPVTITMINPKPLWGPEVKDVINKVIMKEADYEGKEARNGSVLNQTVTTGRAGYGPYLHGCSPAA